MWPATRSAYCSGRSTETALLRVVSDMCEAADSTHVTLAAFLDLSAAFDCVDHVILLERLRLSYGITGTAPNWIKSLLTGRTQCVSFNGLTSLPVTLTCGVPQESVLGPLLFVLYTADVQAIAAAYGVSIHCYAGDIQLYVRCQVGDVVHATARLLACIAAIDKWMAVNKLKLNPEKTQFAWFGTWQQLR